MANNSKVRILAFALLVALLFVLDVLAMHAVFTANRTGANDFYPRWRGAQLYFQEGVDPYSEEATLAIQMGIYGQPARPDQDQLAFVYPFYTALLLLPLLGLSYDWVEAIWLVLIQFSLVGGLLIYLHTLRWRLSPATLAITAVWAALFYNNVRTILLGQFAGPVFLATAALLWALSRRRDVTAGVLLALTTVKPQMVILLIPALLWWALGRGRWRFIISAAATMVVLLAISFLLLPEWLSGFVNQVLWYPSYTDYGNPLTIIGQQYLPELGVPAGVGRAFEVTLSLLLLGWLLWIWRRLPAAKATEARFHYLVGLTLIITNLVVPRTATTNYVVLYLPLFFAFKQLLAEGPRRFWWLALLYLLSTGSMWLLFLETIQGDYEAPIMFLPLPLTLLLLFLWGRERLQRPFVSQA